MWIWWIFIIGGAAYFFATVSRRRNSKTKESLLDILKKRYAKRDISKEDGERMKQDVEGS
jgi:putative membrane protein